MSVTLGDLKDLLLRYSWERRDWPRDELQREFGALVLYVMQQAERLGVDLVSAGEAHISAQAESAPRLLPARPGFDS